MLSDTQLVKNTLSGNTKSYSYLVNRYKNMVLSICFRVLENKEDAEDISQEVFTKAFFSLNKLSDQSKFSNWLYRISYTTSISKVKHLKFRKLKVENIENLTNGIYLNDEFSEPMHDVQQRTIKGALKQLNSDERLLIHLFYYVDCSIEEISYITQKSKGYIKLKLYRTRQKLIKIIKPQLLKD